MCQVRRWTAALALTFVCGCISGGSPFRPAAQKDWPQVLGRSQQAAIDRRYDDAERTLADFAVRFPNTPEATETLYWRGLYRLDPANKDGSISTGLASLDAYLRADAGTAHRIEAETLQRLGKNLEALSRAAAATGGVNSAGTTAAAAGSASADRAAAELKARDTEIQRLKDELAKANDELERIKRRLMTPTKP
jgi:TolA-binding protein